MSEIPDNILKDLLVDPPSHLYSDSKRQNRIKLDSEDDKDDESAQEGVRIVHVKPAGDVIHVFSHIRKTYRVQWVLLTGGGDEPPKLRHESVSPTSEKTKTVRKGKSRQRSEASKDSEASKNITSDVARWVPLDQVEDAKYVKTVRIPNES